MRSGDDRYGAAGFDRHFREIYGERWAALKAALVGGETQVRRPNAFSPAVERSIEGSPRRGEDGLLDVYVMDPASILAARALDARPGDRVLDMCAAPGGKSLVLAEALFGGGDLSGELIANEPSEDRRERLIKVIQQYVPRDVRDRIFVRGLDGARFGLREPGEFDRVLVDAPCSGERHLLENSAELAEWGPRRTERLAGRQYALLAAAWLAVRSGGRIVYSTCSISPAENDEVVAKLVKKKKAIAVATETLRGALGLDGDARAEDTEFGLRFFPDRDGWGPIYFAALGKP